MVPRAMSSFLYYLDFSFKSYNLCAVQPSIINVQLRQTDAPRYEASLHVGRKLKKRTRAWWDDFVSETIIEEWWAENFCMSRAPL